MYKVDNEIPDLHLWGDQTGKETIIDLPGRVIENFDVSDTGLNSNAHHIKLIIHQVWFMKPVPRAHLRMYIVKTDGLGTRSYSGFTRLEMCILQLVQQLTEDSLYLVLLDAVENYEGGSAQGKEAEKNRIYEAHAEGRLKKKFMRKSGTVRVWIELKHEQGTLL